MLKLTKTRNYLELRVGANAAVDVILYLRRTDLEWFHHSSDDANDTMDHTTDLFQVLERTVLPRMLQREIEDSHYKGRSTSSGNNNNKNDNDDNSHVSKKPPPLGPGGIPILAAAKQTQKTAKQQQQQQQPNTKKGATKRKRQTAKEKAAAAAVFHEQAKQDNKREKDVYYAFGQTLQLAYRWQDNTKDSSPSCTATKYLSRHNSASFVFDNKSSSNNNKRGILRQLDKLPKSLEAWVFPFDPTKPNETDPTDGGFPLPERIPIAHLFRGGDGGSTDDKFDDDKDKDKG